MIKLITFAKSPLFYPKRCKMKSRYLLLTCTIAVCGYVPSQAQLLKKIKDKVNKTINNSTGETEKSQDNAGSDNASSVQEKENDKSVKWCDTVTVNGTGKDGVEYSLAYSGSGSINIIYEESSLGLGSGARGYRIIMSERVNNKQQYVVVENGKVIDTDTKVKSQYLPHGSSRQEDGNQGGQPDPAMSKYIVGDTMKQHIPKTDATSVTINKVDDDQFEMAMEMARQSEDYKNMSAAEKKEFEETTKAALAKHNSMAGTTIPVAAQPGGNVAIVNGYFLVIKGKKLGKFQMPPVVDVSKDETKVFAVGLDDKGVPVMIANGKKTLLDKNKYMAIGGYILRSPDQKKFVYVEQKKMSDQETEDFLKASSGNGKVTMTYNVLRSDGSSLSVTDHNLSGKFRLTNSGAVININESTGEVYADNKPIGKFPLRNSDRLNNESVLIGNDISQVAYYNGDDGSLTYLDGTVKKLNILYPKVVSENGKSYLSWFRKCKNDIYIARFAY